MKTINKFLLVRHIFGEENKTEGGIILPGVKTGLIGPYQKGEVILKGNKVQGDINIGDTVLYQYGSCVDFSITESFIEEQYITMKLEK